MSADPTSVVVQCDLVALAADCTAEPVIRGFVDQSVRRLRLVSADLLLYQPDRVQ